MSLRFTNHHITHFTKNWDYYYCLVDNKPAVISVDLHLVDQVPNMRYPNLFYISLKVNHPTSEGFPSADELIELCNIEDTIISHSGVELNSIFGGRVTTNGTRDLIFYVEDIGRMETAMKSVLQNYPDHTYECGSKEDSEWDFYIDFLFPNERELNAIYNHRYTAELSKVGDQPIMERTVTHTLYFPNEEHRDNFILKAIDEFYQVEGIELLPKEEKNRWKTVISRMDSIELHTINKVTLTLLDLAKSEGGMYEGWVTVPMRLPDAV